MSSNYLDVFFDLADLSPTEMYWLSDKSASGRYRQEAGSWLRVHFAILYSVCTYLDTAYSENVLLVFLDLIAFKFTAYSLCSVSLGCNISMIDYNVTNGHIAYFFFFFFGTSIPD